MTLLDRCARLALGLESVEVVLLERPTTGGGVRRTALVRLRGQGKEGRGEEVTFQQADLLETAPSVELFGGVATLAGLWARLDEAELFERAPRHDVVRSYRRWAFEAAALDLALRQAERSLTAASNLAGGGVEVDFAIHGQLERIDVEVAGLEERAEPPAQHLRRRRRLQGCELCSRHVTSVARATGALRVTAETFD